MDPDNKENGVSSPVEEGQQQEDGAEEQHASGTDELQENAGGVENQQGETGDREDQEEQAGDIEDQQEQAGDIQNQQEQADEGNADDNAVTCETEEEKADGGDMESSSAGKEEEEGSGQATDVATDQAEHGTGVSVGEPVAPSSRNASPTQQQTEEGGRDLQEDQPPVHAETTAMADDSQVPPPTAELTRSSPTEQSASQLPLETQQPTPDIPLPPMMDRASETPSAESEKPSPNALNMVWSFGMNRGVPVINMTDDDRQRIAYVCAHTGILYDMQTNKQTLLQGHSNAITCTCVSEDKRWLVTADAGEEDTMVIIWDTHAGIPVRTIFDAHPDGGVAGMAMTPDAKYLATMSAAETQTLAIWDWTVESETPLCTAELKPSYGKQSYILFNTEDVSQVMSSSESQVIFYSWKGGSMRYFAPPLSDDDFNKPVGKFSQSIFLQHSTRVLTATSIGNLVVWDTNKPLTKMGKNKATPDKKALKLVKMQERGINVLTTSERYIVSGDVLGHIKFFDQTLKLLCWYQDFHLGSINSLSFAFDPEFLVQDQKVVKYPSDATIAAKPFVLRDFVVGTTNAIYAHVTTDGTDVKVIHKDHDSAVHGLSSHPFRPWIAVGSYSGCLKIWDYHAKATVVSRWFDKGLMIRCCTFSPDGNVIAVGFMNGSVRVLDAPSLNDVLREPFRYARDAVTHVAFSHNCQYLATADAEYTVTIFKKSQKEPYIYLGRNRAHYKLIVDILFGQQLDSDEPRLLSLGEDRVLVEYDLEGSNQDSLRIMSSDRIEQSAVPFCMEWYPPVTKESFIITANDQFKLKLYNSTTKMCRKTILGPTYGSPLQKVVIVPTHDPVNDKRYMAYITADKIGMQSLPLDGNPHNAMALIAHPQGVVNIVTSHDGRYLFTAGGFDATVHMWSINVDALEAQARLGGEDLIPFYGLLDGGREGELFRELEDFFYYAQIRSQGVNTMDNREVTTNISISEIPFVMRALGFYPSEQEIEDMLNEVKYSKYVETGNYITEIDLGDFIRLYVNHRPAFGLQPEKLDMAFQVLGYPVQGMPTVDRGELLDMLQNRGEHMTEYELAEYLTSLLGYNPEGGSSELQEFDPTEAGDLIDQNLPAEITSDMFANELLGFGMYSDVLKVDHGEGSQQGQPV